MKVRTERDSLRRAIKTVLPPTSTKTSLAVLDCVRLWANDGQLHLTTSDLDLTVRSVVDADVLDEGIALAPCGLLARVLDKLPEGSVEFALVDGLLDIEAGDVQTTLHTMPDEGWPLLPEPESSGAVLTGEHVNLLGRVLLAASVDLNRPPLWCLHVVGDIAECTDSYRAMRATLIGLDLPEANIPASAVGAALRNATGPVEVSVGERHATIASGPDSWTVALVEHPFPNYATMRRDLSPNHIEVDAARVVEAIDRMQVIGGEEAVILQLEGDRLRVSHNQADVGRIDDYAPATGDWTMPFGFNPSHLRHGIEACATEWVTLGLLPDGDALLKPVTLRSEHLEQIIMPVRLGVKSK